MFYFRCSAPSHVRHSLIEMTMARVELMRRATFFRTRAHAPSVSWSVVSFRREEPEQLRG